MICVPNFVAAIVVTVLLVLLLAAIVLGAFLFGFADVFKRD